MALWFLRPNTTCKEAIVAVMVAGIAPTPKTKKLRQW
jgi:hypothetical protein